MGRYRAKRVIVKVLPELTLVFWDWNAIYAYPEGSQQGYVFQKWHAPRGTYFKAWKPFKRRLMKRKQLTFAQCCQLASHYGIVAGGAVGRLDFNKKAVEIRHGKWTVKGVLNDV